MVLGDGKPSVILMIIGRWALDDSGRQTSESPDQYGRESPGSRYHKVYSIA